MTAYSHEIFALTGASVEDMSMQLQDGAVSVTSDGATMLFEANSGPQSVTKSTLNTNFLPVATGSIIAAKMDFYIPAGAPLNEIYLVDFESNNTNIGTSPGARVYLDNGILRVDRSKIGEEEDWVSTHVPIQAGSWYELEVQMTSGEGGAGGIQIMLDGVVVLQETGSTVLTQAVMDQYGITLEGGEIDRVQLGLTANDSGSEASLATRNMEIAIQHSDGASGSLVIDPGEIAANSSRPIEQIPAGTGPIEEIPAGTGSGDDTLFGGDDHDELLGGAGDDVLAGGAGNDKVFGGDGSDIIIDGEGSDSNYGGSGTDAFLFIEGALRGYDDAGQINVFDGGEGEDILYVVLSASTAAQLESSGVSTEQELYGALGLSVRNVEHLEIVVGLEGLDSLVADQSWAGSEYLW